MFASLSLSLYIFYTHIVINFKNLSHFRFPLRIWKSVTYSYLIQKKEYIYIYIYTQDTPLVSHKLQRIKHLVYIYNAVI